MKLWKILLATLIATILVCGCIAMAEEAPKPCTDGCTPSGWILESAATCTKGTVEYRYLCTVSTCANYQKIWEKVERPDAHHTPSVVSELSKGATCADAGYTYYKCTVEGCGATWTEAIKATGKHTWEDKAGMAPTCSAEGYSAYVQCSVCKLIEQKVTLPKVAHKEKYVASLSKPATCTAEGYDFYQCDYGCGYTWTKTVPTIGHDWKDVAEKPATCIAEGYTKHLECSVCKATMYKDVLPKIPHGKDLIQSLSKAPTCTADGYNFYQCIYYGCEHTWTETVPATDHPWVSKDEKPASCTADGYTWHLECPVCKATMWKETIPATGVHNMEEVSVTPATCLKEGTKVLKCANNCGHTETKTLPKVDHTWVEEPAKAPSCGDDGYSAHLKCTVKDCKATAGKVVIPAEKAHKWKQNPTTAATCTTKGWENWECELCGKTEKRNEVDKLGHDISVMVAHAEATCTAEGFETKQCVRCTEQKTTTLAKIAHNYVEAGWSERVAATCNSEGQAYRVCTKCGGAEQVKAIAALGHKMAKDPIVVKAADCTKDGEGYNYCERCTLRETIVIKALGHKEKAVVVAAADCVNVGMKHVDCERCGKRLEKNVVVPALGHKGKVTASVAATCTTEGSKTTECERCNKTVTEKIAKLDHKYGWVETVKPSAAGNGKREYKCSVCGHVAETQVIKYSSWYHNNTMTSFGPTTRELVGGNDWYRVTPVDLTVDGVYTYDLIASNKYIVGSVTISVNAGTMSVSYKVKNNVEVTDESLLIYASKADLAAGTAVTAPVGAAINVAETFGADNQVLVSLVLTGDYDAAGKSIMDDAAASALVANID